ncbi:unnamed protein product [Spirodela intermedia]|uniref:Uncharacterized protein n=1 Tax=Spirodela intermedia TaxID=51605 RepID=A0A7I8KC08_SPIIN|nr:unnamed protein product [Spirodela intermedia]
MDSRQLFRHSLSSEVISFKAAATAAGASAWSQLPASVKLNLGNSPDSPFSTPLDCDAFPAPSTTTQDRHSISPPEPTDSKALRQIETMLMAPDNEAAAAATTTTSSRRHDADADADADDNLRSRKRQRAGPEVKRLLLSCAEALAEDRAAKFKGLAQETREVVSITGEPLQRLGAYMLEGLVARQEASGATIYRALRCEGRDLLSHMQILYDICPYFKFGYMAANGAIAEAVRHDDRVHIVDFQIAQGTQWVTLLQALAARPGGPPRVRITGLVDDDGGPVAERLAAVSRRFRIPVEFRPVGAAAQDVTPAMLDVREGEALAVSFTLQLHHTPDESVEVGNPRDGLLRMVKGLGPRVVTLVEQESNTNTTPFLTRFAEALDYYAAMFESIEVALPRGSGERIGVEQQCLARDIVNVVACEGRERVERHELLGKWRSRLGMAGFRPYPLSRYVNEVIRGLLGAYSGNYRLREEDGAVLLGWKQRDLISASAWH